MVSGREENPTTKKNSTSNEKNFLVKKKLCSTIVNYIKSYRKTNENVKNVN